MTLQEALASASDHSRSPLARGIAACKTSSAGYAQVRAQASGGFIRITSDGIEQKKAGKPLLTRLSGIPGHTLN